MKKKIILAALLLVLILGGCGAYWFWKIYYRPNVHLADGKSEFLFISTGTTMPELLVQLNEMKLVEDTASFMLIADLKKFKIPKPGRYRIKDGMDNRDLVNLLRAGLQEPVEFSFNNIRTKEKLAGRVGGKLEADSARFLMLLNDAGFLSKYGLTTENIMTLFIPNTYELNWNTSEEQFFERMSKEYKKFWNEERKSKAAAIPLSQSDVIILASIVESEQMNDHEEQAVVAGLYINRLRKRIPLQADPTLIFALGDFSILRVLDADKEIDSPYNTYKYAGLPPGPIRIPTRAAVDAVLNYYKSNYIYMCAEFGTGHNKFTADYNEHLRNAKAFTNALNKAQIKR
ncbi:MAG: endolytic transglycosylase MltG [Bacteroidota bacterium]|nr:endolytic transglycosylase MltG [Bacteroidota bacterium]